MRKLKSLENFDNTLAAEKLKMFCGGATTIPGTDTFVAKDGDFQSGRFAAVLTNTYVEQDGDVDVEIIID